MTDRPIALLLLFSGLLIAAGSASGQEKSADGWHRVSIPDAWRKVPTGDLAPIDGYSWYRCLVRVPAEWEGARIELFVEALDDARATYVNGVRVGATGTFPPQFRSGLGEKGVYRIDGDLLKAGQFNTIAIRVFQNDPRPNFSVAPPVLLHRKAGQGMRLEGVWQYRPGDNPEWAIATGEDFGVTADDALTEEQRRGYGLYEAVDTVENVDRYVTRRRGDKDPLPPEAAEAAFQTPDDLRMELVLSEPQIAQPLHMTWDHLGRLWVTEYRQYPEVAGVRMVSRDVYLRSVYDKVPKPPPHGARGRDRISIHEDTDGDGLYDSHKVFVDGLNLATSCVPARGGVFVTNPPYLLFYPDRNGDDKPDADPEVLLEGFGLEDSHSVINSLRMGPDGWLYGAQGSTVTASVRRPGSKEPAIRTMGQLIWRYHPDRRRFEVFAEGGGNTFGVEIDSKGNIFSGHNGGDTRGFHYVQGGYYRKGFGKHGPLSNPFAFGYFNQMTHHSVPRFTHNFIIYEEDILPQQYRGRLFGVEPLQGQIVMSEVLPFQSSFATRDISRVVKTDDQWFRPVDIKAGPDGCIYIADFYEQRIDHSSHYAGRIDRTNGRIYRLRPATGEIRIRKVDTENLPAAVGHPAKQLRQAALCVIGDRKDASLASAFLDQVGDSTDQLALESLWALHLCGGLTDSVAVELLRHADPYVRAWTVRLVCDRLNVDPDVAATLAQIAADEPYIQVRKQLASSSRRLPPRQAIPILRELLKYDEDADDIHQPLLLWWAFESQVSSEGIRLMLQSVFSDPVTWQRPLVRRHIAERLMKRFALSGQREELLAAAALLKAAPDRESADLLLAGFEDAFKGRSLAILPKALTDAIAASGGGSLALRVRQGDSDAIRQAMLRVSDATVDIEERRQLLEIFGEVRREEFVPVLLRVVESESNPQLTAAALTALQAFDDHRIGKVVVRELPGFSAEVRPVAETLLASRRKWAVAALTAVDSARLEPSLLSESTLRKMLLHNDPEVNQLIRKHWGEVSGASTEQMRAELDHVRELLNAGSGNPKKGKPIYMKNCGKCHRLFGEGGQIGPDLTAFRRDDLDRILVNVINPGLEIREGFESYIAVTTDGRVLNGFLADKDNRVIVLRGVDGQNVILRRDEVDELVPSRKSIMPEGTLKGLSDQEIRDLFAYLRSSQPVNY